jgi:MFS family permease
MELTSIRQKKFLKPTFMAAFFTVAAYIYYPFLAPYLISHGFTEAQISAIFSFSPFVLIFFGAVMGKLSDHLGRKSIINFTLLVYITAVLLYLYVDRNIFVLSGAIILSAIGLNGYFITILQRVEDNIKTDRGLLTGVFESIRSGGALIGPLIGTLIVTFLPITYTFKVTIIFLLILLIINTTLKEKNHAGFKKGDLNFVKDIKEFWKEKKLRGMGILGMAMHFCAPAQVIFIPLFIINGLGGNLQDIGIFASIYGFFHLFQFIPGKLCDENGSKKIILSSVLIFAMLLIGLYFVTTVFAIFIFAALFSIFGSFWNTSAWCYMSKIGEKIKKEGLVTGSYVSVAKIGGLAGYLLSAILIGFFGTRLLFVFYGAIIIFAVIISANYFVKKIRE